MGLKGLSDVLNVLPLAEVSVVGALLQRGLDGRVQSHLALLFDQSVPIANATLVEPVGNQPSRVVTPAVVSLHDECKKLRPCPKN